MTANPDSILKDSTYNLLLQLQDFKAVLGVKVD